jgi:filamentous hemagglutinin family protein
MFTVGTGTITQSGTATNVVVDQIQSIIEWSSLDTVGGAPGVRESLNFSQGSLTDSAVLIRVFGTATQFNGDLSAPGMRIFIVNSAGILFGEGSTINVTQLAASGLDMSNDNFLNAIGDQAQDFVFEGGSGEVLNWGTTQADGVCFIGKKVINYSAVVAPEGLVVMAAGDNVYLAQDGSNVAVELDADPGGDFIDVQNRSLISADDGTIVLAAGDTFSRAVSNIGFLVASAGTITAHAGRIENQGTITVDGEPDGEGGSISLVGMEDVLLAPDPPAGMGETTANAGFNGNGGTITIESGDMVTIGADALVEARGGSESGNGGFVKITSEHFAIAGDIDASPENTDYEPGTLEIDPPTVTIADGPNAGALDTIYEEDIEALSDAGTSVVVYADDSITVQDILDDEITGRFGNIELHATGASSLVSFGDIGDTISTTLGDIVIEAGNGGITVGDLITAKDWSDIKPTPGEIILTTANGGDITTENLSINDGWGHAEIYVGASGDLTVNGDVIVGRDSDILNLPDGQDAEALIYLSAGDNVVLNGDVGARAHGTHADLEGSVTTAYIGVFAGTNGVLFGDAYIDSGLVADAQSSSNGTSKATIEINAWGEIEFAPGVDAHAIADNGAAEVQGTESAEENSPDGDIAQIIISEQGNVPGIEGFPDFVETHMGDSVSGNVLDNDFDPEGDPLTAELVTEVEHGVLVLSEDGSFSYTPDPGYVGDDSFTYRATDGVDTTDPVLVTITVTNTLPTLCDDVATTIQGVAVVIDVLANDADPDGDPLAVYSFVYGGTGTLVLNEDGTFTYDPEDGYVGDDSFTYSATDGEIGAEPVQATVTITVTQGVLVDIKPQSCPNPLNVGSPGGTLPVAIVGTQDFDVTAVNPFTVRLIGAAPWRFSLEDVCTPYYPLEGKKTQFCCTEEGPDRTLDLTLKFRKREIVDALGEVNDGDEIVLMLTGNLFDGTPIVGEDVVRILKKK